MKSVEIKRDPSNERHIEVEVKNSDGQQIILISGTEIINKKLMTGGRVVLRTQQDGQTLPIGSSGIIAALTGKTTVIN